MLVKCENCDGSGVVVPVYDVTETGVFRRDMNAVRISCHRCGGRRMREQTESEKLERIAELLVILIDHVGGKCSHPKCPEHE